jgi:two-component system, OmpR family, response regulator
MAKIFWVEDQFHWIDKFKPILLSADFGDGANTGASDSANNELEVHKFVEAACTAIKQHKTLPDVVILDANMNGNDDAGLTVSRLLAKKWPKVPVIYLSEHSGTRIEEKAFEQTDTQDFIAKHQPNVEQILCWRIKALLRHRALQRDKSSELIISGDLKIDLINWELSWFGERLMNPNNHLRPLAPTPRKILKFLVEASPRPVSTLQMAEKLELDKFNYSSYRQHIKTLRHSIAQAAKVKNRPDFLALCRNNQGIVTFGDQGAYQWIKCSN